MFLKKKIQEKVKKEKSKGNGVLNRSEECDMRIILQPTVGFENEGRETQTKGFNGLNVRNSPQFTANKTNKQTTTKWTLVPQTEEIKFWQ